jgi:3-oxoacid CoA-transferase
LQLKENMYRSRSVLSRLQLVRAHFYSTEAAPSTNNKIWKSAKEAIADLPSGSTVLCGGFGLCGVPDTLIKELADQHEKKDLTIVSNNAGVEDGGVGIASSRHSMS